MREVLKVGMVCKGYLGLGPHFIKTPKDLKQGNCRQCCILRGRLYLKRNNKAINKRRRAKYALDPSPKKASDIAYRKRHLGEHKMYDKEYADKNIEKFMIYSAKRRAKKYRVPFVLNHTDFSVPEVCPVLGIKLKRGVGGSTNSSPTLDRNVPALGYVKGNVTVISSLANRIKTDATIEQVEAVLRWMKSWARQ